MTTWIQDSVASATWSAAQTILYLLTEAGENLLDEASDLILLNRGQLATWTEDETAAVPWTQKTVVPSSWTQDNVQSAVWTEKEVT